ncbi:MAG: hypothetical protein JSW35_00490 [Deltaproteobacteria bacterium]|nr:MAG: hypothetical protein JSW35_00490 [Deltaproteobacteria bacterium]
MTIQATNSSDQNPLPSHIIDFVAVFMRALNTARLYARGHDIFKKHIQQLYTKLGEAMADRDFLFLGCASDTLFLEGTFYQARDVHLQKFLKFFHALRISYILLDKEITPEELESFIGLLAGAQQGQGDEVCSALPRENIKHVRLGPLDYTIFSTAQKIAAQITQTTEDEAIWRQLILQPPEARAFNLGPEQAKRLTRLCEDAQGLKKLLLQMDADMAERQQGANIAHRGALLGNFIQNLADILSGIAPIKRKLFAQQVGGILDSLELPLKIHILGSVTPDAIREKDSDVFHEIFQAMPDNQLVYLLGDALKEAGANSPCFRNLLNQALTKYKKPCPLLNLIRQEIRRAIQAGKSATLSHWQQLEQLLIRQEEMEDFNKQYRKEIEALATSSEMKVPMVEEEEMARLLKTLAPESLRLAKAQLIINLISGPHATRPETYVPPLLKGIGEILSHFLSQGDFLTAGNLLRELFLVLSDYPEEASLRKAMNSLLDAEEIRPLLLDLLKRCRTYEPQETATIDAICQLCPVKAGGFLLDVLVELKDNDSPRGRWLTTTLVGLGPSLRGILSRSLLGAPDHALPRLLSLATISTDKNLATAVGQLLEHSNHEIRIKAASTLGALKAEGPVPRLAEIVLQKSWLRTKKMKSLQVAAAQALAEIGTDKARDVLQQVISQGPGDLQALCQELL